jgi:thiol-disulfide isomerase/thioredoxin
MIVVVIYLLTKYSKNTTSSEEEVQKEEPFKQHNTHPKLILYYSDHCHHCHDLMPAWNSLNFGKHVEVHKINCGEDTNMKQCSGITGYPTIIYRDDMKKVTYTGDRSKEDMTKFVMNNLHKK